MKKIMLMGSISCGKTTLCQYINQMEQVYHKTQTIQAVGNTLDTPGEYMENRSLLRGLIVSAAGVDEVFFLQDCTSSRFCFSPGQAAMFACPVSGIVTKADLAETPQQLLRTQELLQTAGAGRIFTISSTTGMGMEELMEYLEEGHALASSH